MDNFKGTSMHKRFWGRFGGAGVSGCLAEIGISQVGQAKGYHVCSNIYTFHCGMPSDNEAPSNCLFTKFLVSYRHMPRYVLYAWTASYSNH